jgi:hypothetical protein
MPGSNIETLGRFCDGLGSYIMVFITLHARITAREYVDSLGNQVHAVIQTLFPNNDAVFQDDSAHVHTAGTVHSLKSMKVNFNNFRGQRSLQI